ncbi:MAG: Hsp20/alpha crystallin family protein [Bdellovibrionaceae bacterium]|nr:Hsp20/alpha crystallin family protein [Pseudobdellovibrionaceae bacterium]
MKSQLTTRRNRNSLWDFMNEVDQAFGNGFFNDRQLTESTSFYPAVDIVEHEDSYLISADLPGMKNENIHLDVNEGVLTISGERMDEKKSSDQHYRRYEKRYGKFVRSFRIPDSVNADKIEACFEDGVLEVLIPKSEKVLPQKIEVKQSKEGLFSKIMGKKEEGKH